MSEINDKKSVGSIIFSIFKYISLIIASLISIIPVVVCVFTAFKTNEEYQATSVLSLPSNFFNFENFAIAIKQANMLRCFLNTGIVLVVVLTVSVLTGSMLAYVLNRFKFPGSGFLVMDMKR